MVLSGAHLHLDVPFGFAAVATEADFPLGAGTFVAFAVHTRYIHPPWQRSLNEGLARGLEAIGKGRRHR